MKNLNKESSTEKSFKTNWDDVSKKTSAISLANRLDNTSKDESNLQILKKRAKQLAKPLKAVSNEEMIEIIEFTMAFEKYALESSYIREIVPLREIVPIPSTPSFVVGITNVRGQILSVVDMKILFELPNEGLSDLNKIIIVRYKDMEFGLLADSIIGMKTVSLNSLQLQLPTLTGIRSKYLLGISDEKVIILDGEKLLTDKKLVVNYKNEN
jgi:purine-binding chemotaxis protein CheW